jgi:hypothetical protein
MGVCPVCSVSAARLKESSRVEEGIVEDLEVLSRDECDEVGRRSNAKADAARRFGLIRAIWSQSA